MSSNLTEFIILRLIFSLIIVFPVVLVIGLSSCAYTPARAYRLTDSEVHEAKHEYLERKVEHLQEQVYELRDKLEEAKQ